MSDIDLEQLLSPISDASPSGEDARYEFSYEMMESEVKKFGSLFGETVDWAVVKTHAMEVLQQHSKDLKALCYLTRALVEESGLSGFEQGLTLLNESLSRYGETLYPTRKRGRDGAVEWLNHQFKLCSPKIGESPNSWQQVSDCISKTEEIQRQFDDLFQDSEADFFEIRSQLNTLSQQAVADDEPVAHKETLIEPPADSSSAPKEVLPASVATEPVQTPAPAVKKSVVQEVDVETDFSSPTASKRSLKKVAEVMIHASPSDPLAYRIYRYLTWDDIDALPEHQDNQTPLILAVSSDQQAEYRDKAQQETDIESVKRLERTLTDAPFWLTGHYLVHSMLVNLGFDEAAAAVRQEAKRFADSLEGIENLSFKNSIPFADETTIQWLSSSVVHSSSSQPVVQTVVIAEEDSSLMEDITLENLGERAADLAQRLELDSSGRSQFMLYLQLIEAYQSVGLTPLTLPYLEKVWQMKSGFDLASWEPHLSSQLDKLTREAVHTLYKTRELLPEKYEQWQAFYD
mgnify:CR=1 FL=1